MVADAVEGLAAEVERGERDIGSPLGVVVPAVDEGAERVFAGVTARAVAAVVTKCDCFGERDVEPKRPGDCRCDLGNFECVGETRSLMVVGKDEDLCLAGEPTKGRRMEDAISITFETCAERVGFFGSAACPRTDRPRGVRREKAVFVIFAFVA